VQSIFEGRSGRGQSTVPRPSLLYSHDGGNDEGHHLSRCHDDGEDDRPELLDGVEDEELAGGGGDGQRHDVEQGLGVLRKELDAHHELPALRVETQIQDARNLKGFSPSSVSVSFTAAGK